MFHELEFHGYVIKVNAQYGSIYTPPNSDKTAIVLMNNQTVATFQLNPIYGENKLTIDTAQRLVLEGNTFVVIP